MDATHSRGFLGSSPRVRGKVISPAAAPVPDGIIPAGAGKSQAASVSGANIGDHPRGCGEKFDFIEQLHTRKGSSPRVRGKACSAGQGRLRVGIIPAGAGKSHGVRRRGSSSWDHPRGCGEKSSPSVGVACRLGSSPRVRGKGSGDGGDHADSGIIPAGAGKSVRRESQRGIPWDHPRGCGEKAVVP